MKAKIVKTDLPYAVDIDVMNQIMRELSRVGDRGERKIDLFKQINANNGPTKSHALRFCKFLGICKQEQNMIHLTPLGSNAYLSNDAGKKLILAKNLPGRYLTLLKWLDVEGGKSIYEIKQDISKNWNENPPDRLFGLMINTLARYFEYLGLVKYIKGGPASRLEITKLGHDIVSAPVKTEKGSQQKYTETIKSDPEERSVRDVLVELLYSVNPTARKPKDIIHEITKLKHQLPLEQQSLADILEEHSDKNEVIESIVKRMLGIIIIKKSTEIDKPK